ncbi:diaminopimelate decarboxylase family protein [Agathobacter rectalis]|jgi:diaminopimelate decarboxylase|uniref:diaminopimelate decarboxylase family protein n=1 Tax=Agathobacter rectalis TaxID=39491 RepID=UPI0027D1FB73|nr:diaminopimelate decarboxylase [Agathobacter rectalis]
MRQTPYYVFDTDEFAKRAAMIRAALDCKGGRRIPLCFSIKANPFLLHRLPAGLDHVEVCSPGELEICIALGVKPESIIYSGVMKEKCDIERAVSYGAGILTCESIRHAALISEVMLECIQEGAHEAEFAETKAQVILRLTSGNQFGMSLEDIEYIISHPDEFKGITVMGIHYYSGTQKSLRKINKDLEKIKSALSILKEKYGFEPQLVEYGPGLCVEYFEEDWQEKEKQSLDEAAEVLRKFAEEYPLGIEMGRFLAASCGKYYTQVKDLKSTGDANYAILDGGIHHLNYFGQRMAMQVPPISIYRADEIYFGEKLGEIKGAAGPIGNTFNGCEVSENEERTVVEFTELPDTDYTLCGSLCTVADVLVREVKLKKLELGDVLEFGHCGAYSVTEAPALFLSRQLPAVYAYSKEYGYECLREHIPAAEINLAGKK